MIVYKLMHLRKDGTLGSLFCNKAFRVPLNKWMWAGNHPARGIAERQGWHTVLEPEAPHLSKRDRVWCKVEVKYLTNFRRPGSQGELWVLAKRMRVLEILG